jgi:hypothetical protein
MRGRLERAALELYVERGLGADHGGGDRRPCRTDGAWERVAGRHCQYDLSCDNCQPTRNVASWAQSLGHGCSTISTAGGVARLTS